MSFDDGSDKVIFTDNEITKYFIWTAYEGLDNYYIHWRMSLFEKRNVRRLNYGITKYILLFLIRIKALLADKKLANKLEKDDVSRAVNILNNLMIDVDYKVCDEDVHFVRCFAEDFMTKTGLKDIARKGRSELPGSIQ